MQEEHGTYETGPQHPDPRIEDLRNELRQLQGVVARVAEASAIENVMSNGFAQLMAQLEPLRELAPKRTPMSDAAYAYLRQLRESLQRPRFVGSAFEVEVGSDSSSKRSAAL